MSERHILKLSCGIFTGITGFIAEEWAVDKAAYRPETSIAAFENEYVPWKDSVRKDWGERRDERARSI